MKQLELTLVSHLSKQNILSYLDLIGFVISPVSGNEQLLSSNIIISLSNLYPTFSSHLLLNHLFLHQNDLSFNIQSYFDIAEKYEIKFTFMNIAEPQLCLLYKEQTNQILTYIMQVSKNTKF